MYIFLDALNGQHFWMPFLYVQFMHMVPWSAFHFIIQISHVVPQKVVSWVWFI